jgi:hypothetical protein
MEVDPKLAPLHAEAAVAAAQPLQPVYGQHFWTGPSAAKALLSEQHSSVDSIPL